MVVDNPLIAIVAHLHAGVYTCAAGGTILIYDILLTTKDEMRLIWPSRFSLVKCLYFINRYLPVPCLILGMYLVRPFSLPTPPSCAPTDITTPPPSCSCKLVTLSQMIGQAISLIAATWLLVLRVLALYGGNKWVTIALYTVFISTHLVTIVLSIMILSDMWGGLSYLPYLGICAGSGPPARTLGVAYLSPVLCESVLVTMQLFHAWRHTRQLQNLLRPTTPLLRTLYADGFAYFVIVAGLRLWSAFIFIAADVSYWYISTYLEFALISTSVSRLVLHLRGSAEVHRSCHLDMSTNMPMSTLTQNTNNPNNPNNNPNENPLNAAYHITPDRKSYRPSRRLKSKPPTKQNAHTTSSFQNPSHTIYEYDLDCPYIYHHHHPSSSQEAPPPQAQVHFSSSEHLRRPSSFVERTGVHGGYGGQQQQQHGEEGHRCELCCEDLDVVVTVGRNDDHSYVGFFPVGPAAAPMTIGHVEAGGRGGERDEQRWEGVIEEEVEGEREGGMRLRDGGGSPVKPPGIEDARGLSPGIG